VYIDSLPEVLITEFFADVIIFAISSLACPNIITQTVEFMIIRSYVIIPLIDHGTASARRSF